jgi:hypothetical protein
MILVLELYKQFVPMELVNEMIELSKKNLNILR